MYGYNKLLSGEETNIPDLWEVFHAIPCCRPIKTTSLNPVVFFCSQLFCSNFTNMLKNFSAIGQLSYRLKCDRVPLSKTFSCVKSVLSLLCVINCDSKKVNSLLFNKHDFVSKTMHHLFTFNQPIRLQHWDPRKYERQFRARVINTTSSTPFRDFFLFYLQRRRNWLLLFQIKSM